MKKLTDFATKAEFFQYLHANKAELIEMRKAAQKFTDPYGLGVIVQRSIKALNTSFVDNPESGEIKRTIILNTYNWMDSHCDVHLDNVFKNSIKERQDRIFHLHDHLFQVTAKVGRPERIYEKKVAWADLGIDKAGDTMALFMDSMIQRDWNDKVFLQYLKNEIDQHSVAMQYVQLDLAMNDPEYKHEFKLLNKILPTLGNPDKAEQLGFFWVVEEAKVFEGSCVLEGSNQLTPTLPNGEDASEKSEVEVVLETSAERFMKSYLR